MIDGFCVFCYKLMTVSSQYVCSVYEVPFCILIKRNNLTFNFSNDQFIKWMLYFISYLHCHSTSVQKTYINIVTFTIFIWFMLFLWHTADRKNMWTCKSFLFSNSPIVYDDLCTMTCYVFYEINQNYMQVISILFS